jgi:hypothetical protein
MEGVRPRRPKRGCVQEPTDAEWELIEDCWHHSPKKRPTMEKALARCAPTPAPWATSERPQLEILDENVHLLDQQSSNFHQSSRLSMSSLASASRASLREAYERFLPASQALTSPVRRRRIPTRLLVVAAVPTVGLIVVIIVLGVFINKTSPRSEHSSV